MNPDDSEPAETVTIDVDMAPSYASPALGWAWAQPLVLLGSEGAALSSATHLQAVGELVGIQKARAGLGRSEYRVSVPPRRRAPVNAAPLGGAAAHTAAPRYRAAAPRTAKARAASRALARASRGAGGAACAGGARRLIPRVAGT